MNDKNKINHIAFILDGNRRYASKLKQMSWKGHEDGANKIKDVLEWCRDADIKEVSMYAFSIQNFSRDKKEINFLFDIFRKFLDQITDDKSKNDLTQYGVKVRFIGEIELFPDDIYEKMNNIINKTKNNKKYILNLCMAYGGRKEILNAVKEISAEVKAGTLDIKNIDEDLFSQHLLLQSPPDLIIRTSGERRTSNFLPWQSIYSEWAFPKFFWPEFSKKDFNKILNDYYNRERRFGK